MNEDLSATIRTGVTVTVVAALVSTVLSLLVIAQTILSGGMVKLQSVVSAVNVQDFEPYNNGAQSGTEVKAAISQYSGSDIAILVRSISNKNGTNGSPYFWNYCALLDTNGAGITGASGASTEVTYQLLGADNKTFGAPQTVAPQLTGNSYLTSAFKTLNGVIQFNGNTKGIATKGSVEYILASSTYSSMLIKDNNGLIIGIVFTQR